MLLFRSLFVCPSVTFVHCAQTAKDIDTISFTYDSHTCLSDCVKIWLTLINPFLSKFCSRVTVDLSVGDIRCGRMVTDSAMVTTTEACRKLPSFFWMVLTIADHLYDLPFPPNLGPKCNPSKRCRLLPNCFAACFFKIQGLHDTEKDVDKFVIKGAKMKMWWKSV